MILYVWVKLFERRKTMGVRREVNFFF